MMKIRHLLIVSMLFAAALIAAPWSENERLALNEAVVDVKADIARKSAAFENRNLLLLPVMGDQDRFLFKTLKAALLEKGLHLLEEDKSEGFEAIAGQFSWDEQMGDILHKDDLLQFGKLRGAQAIVYGRIRELSSNDERVYAEIELFATQIDTRELLWGGIFVGRLLANGNTMGRFTEDVYVVKGINEAFRQFDEALAKSPNLAKLASKNIAIISLAGDNDDYVTDRTLEILNNNKITSRKLGYSTLAQARRFIGADKLKADAYLYGAVRSMYRLGTPLVEEISYDKKRTTFTQRVFLEISLRIADANEDVLWSKTIAEPIEIRDVREATPEELVEGRKDAYLKWFLWGLGGIVAILLLLFLFLVIFRAIMSNVKIR